MLLFFYQQQRRRTITILNQVKHTSILGFATLLSASLLASCGTLPKPKETKTKCKGKATSSGDLEAECEIEITWQTNNNYNNLSQLMNETISISFAESDHSFSYNQASTNGSIVLKHDGAVVGAEASQYQTSGSEVIAANPSGLATQLSQYDGQANEIVMTIQGVTFPMDPGANTYVAEVMHNNSVISGSSDSIYWNPSDDDPSTTPGDDGIL